MAWPLLTTKLHIPRARPEWVPRPRLLARLDELGLTLVSVVPAATPPERK